MIYVSKHVPIGWDSIVVSLYQNEILYSARNDIIHLNKWSFVLNYDNLGIFKFYELENPILTIRMTYSDFDVFRNARKLYYKNNCSQSELAKLKLKSEFCLRVK